MDWVQWLIPLVALAVWILSNLARNREDEPRRARPPQVRGDEQPREKKPEEVDRFLDEVRRRRETADARKRKVDEPRRVLPRREEQRKPLQPPASRPEAPRRPAPPPLPPSPPPKPVVVKEPPPLPRPAAGKVEDVVVARIVTASPGGETAIERVASGPAKQQIFDLLCRKNNLNTAVLLREILGPPLSKQPFGVTPIRRK
jgi:hypothetical protein